MPEEERAAEQEQEEFKLRSCKHKNCKYRATSQNAYGVYNCDYALATGHTRAAQHPPDKRQPADCMLYEPRTGKKPRRPLYRQDEHQEKGCVPAAVHKPLPQALPELHP